MLGISNSKIVNIITGRLTDYEKNAFSHLDGIAKQIKELQDCFQAWLFGTGIAALLASLLAVVSILIKAEEWHVGKKLAFLFAGASFGGSYIVLLLSGFWLVDKWIGQRLRNKRNRLCELICSDLDLFQVFRLYQFIEPFNARVIESGMEAIGMVKSTEELNRAINDLLSKIATQIGENILLIGRKGEKQ